MAIVLYASDKNLSEDHVPLTVKGWRDGKERTIYVRAELIEDAWPGAAFKGAKARADEICLNAVPNGVVVRPK